MRCDRAAPRRCATSRDARRRHRRPLGSDVGASSRPALLATHPAHRTVCTEDTAINLPEAMIARGPRIPEESGTRALPPSGVACRAMEDDRSSTPAPGSEPWEGTTRELAAALRDLVARLREEQGQPLPEAEAFLQSPSSLRRRLKTLVFRTTRPAT